MRRRREPGQRRAEILDVAAEQFARNGYDDTRWADVAARVGIGSTALYHYFESKQPCRFELIADSIAGFRGRFDEHVTTHDEWLDALSALLRGGFELSDADVMRRRVLAAEQGRPRQTAASAREEAARENAEARRRDHEFAWGTFLARGMQQGLLPERDSQLLARALLGLYNSVWVWYRPGGALSLDTVGAFYIQRELALLGVQSRA